ncbi:MAG TPA: class I adenylate-forming enzyme family protein [Solirubrobacteraceae bacterium]|nr:class I adenylate-forming enzyme family protein [Solirubrobacteraceae bacterium]
MNAIDHLLEIPARHGERPFMIDARSGETVTFGCLHDDARRVAADLRRRGLRRGDRLALVLNNSTALARLYLGCLYAGVVTVPVNPALAAPEIEFILRHSGARMLVLSGETERCAPGLRSPPMEPSMKPAAELSTLLLADGRAALPAGSEPWDPCALEADGTLPLDSASPEDTMTIVYTSGTTGRPSGVVHRIGDLIDNGRLFGAIVGVQPHHRFYGVLAMTYLGGYYNLMMLPYVNCASVVLTDAFDARAALDFFSPAARHGVNALWLVPAIMSILLEMDRGSVGEDLCRNAIDLALVGTAPLPPSLRRAFEQRYGVRLLENYGLSETLFLTTNVRQGETIDGSVGRVLPGVKVRVDEGELLVRTPYLMEGYYDAQREGPARLDPGVWFPTGDVGHIDSEGNVFITGRRKDLIIRGGVNVSPAAAEDVLLEHPSVAECAVIGVPHPLYGEDSAAVVRLLAGADEAQTRRELLAACRERLGATNRPARIVFLKELPHSSSGKVQKSRLRELLSSEAAAVRT